MNGLGPAKVGSQPQKAGCGGPRCRNVALEARAIASPA